MLMLLKTAFGFLTGGLSTVVSWALDHWKAALAILAAFALMSFVAVLLLERDHARAQLAAAQKTVSAQQTRIADLQQSVSVLTAEIGKQNTAVAALGQEAIERQQQAQAAMAAADKANATIQAQIAALTIKNAAPTAKGATCEQAFAEWRAGR